MSGRIRLVDLSIIGVFVIAGVYSGTKFFEPIVIDTLKKDGALRKDIAIPEYNNEGVPVANEKTLANLKEDLTQIYEQGRKERGLDPNEK